MVWIGPSVGNLGPIGNGLALPEVTQPIRSSVTALVRGSSIYNRQRIDQMLQATAICLCTLAEQ